MTKKILIALALVAGIAGIAYATSEQGTYMAYDPIMNVLYVENEFGHLEVVECDVNYEHPPHLMPGDEIIMRDWSGPGGPGDGDVDEVFGPLN